MTVKGAKSNLNEDNYNDYKKVVEDFLTLLIKYAPDQDLDRDKYFIMNPYVLQGIAKCIYLLKQNDRNFDMEGFFQKVVRLFDWSHKNKELKQLGIPYYNKTKKYSSLAPK